MEKLYELHQEARYDLIVVDTPPTRHALDFLDAPERLSRFIDSRSLQLFLRPGRSALKMLGRGSGDPVLRAQARHRRRPAPGPVGVLPELRRHAEGFRERAERVNELLGDRRTTFLLVTSPERDADRGGHLLPPARSRRRTFRSAASSSTRSTPTTSRWRRRPAPTRRPRRSTASSQSSSAPSTGRPGRRSWRRRSPRTSRTTGCSPSAIART